jgi:hypothetical protein
MSKIAIDIVLLPDERAQTICRAVNQYIWGKIDFNATWKVPHISLMMWVVEEWKILQIFEILTEISKYFFLVNLRWLLKKYTIWNTGETGYSYELEENISIKKIFSEICEKIRPQLEYKDIALDMFYMPEEVEQQSVLWVKWFEERVVEEFSSHITLGIWELTWEHAKVIHFSTPKLAVYQLGNYCTCENKLFEINL